MVPGNDKEDPYWCRSISSKVKVIFIFGTEIEVCAKQLLADAKANGIQTLLGYIVTHDGRMILAYFYVNTSNVKDNCK